MKSRLRFSTLICCTLLFFTPIALRAAERNVSYSLQRVIDKLFTRKITARASTAVKVVSAETGEVLYERNASALLTPASTMKLISSATALATLGRDYSFRTVISTDDTTHDPNIIHGNLYLQGYGDPYLTSTDLKNLAAYLSKQGLREVQGDVEGDESFFDHASACVDQNGNDHSSIRLPHLSALTVDLNLLTVILAPSKRKGAKAKVEFPAGGSFFKVANQCVTVNERVRYRP
ncbi:MAG: D-alanyl-D-alanine carboxypeptidase, partial [Bacteroidota bacterium]